MDQLIDMLVPLLSTSVVGYTAICHYMDSNADQLKSERTKHYLVIGFILALIHLCYFNYGYMRPSTYAFGVIISITAVHNISARDKVILPVLGLFRNPSIFWSWFAMGCVFCIIETLATDVDYLEIFLLLLAAVMFIRDFCFLGWSESYSKSNGPSPHGCEDGDNIRAVQLEWDANFIQLSKRPNLNAKHSQFVRRSARIDALKGRGTIWTQQWVESQ